MPPAATPPEPGPLVGIHEVADLAGVSRQHAAELVNRPTFPEPVAVLRMGRVWDRPAVERWAREWQATKRRARS